MPERSDAHARRLACQIFTQLPESQGDALKVLEYVRQIIFNLGNGWREEAPSDVIQLYPKSGALLDREGG